MMKKKRWSWLKENRLFFFLSIVIPLIIMAIAYYSIGVYWGSDKTILASDSYSQIANFYAGFNDMLHGKQSIFYSWYGSLGLNYWALMAYYLNGIFTFIVYFFDNSMIPDAVYLIILLKFGAMGGSFGVMSQQLFRIPKWAMLGFSTFYAISGFALIATPMVMWLDALIYLPLVILGIHRLLEQGKAKLLFFSYLLLFISNFYMAFMVGVFSFLYAVGLVILKPEYLKKGFPLYLFTSLCAGGASMVTILPTILDLINNGEGLTGVTSFFTPDTGAWDLIVKSMVGVYDTTGYESAPFIYFGLFALPFLFFYFRTAEIALKRKLVSGGMFLLLIASVYIYPLNLFWHGFHAPNMFLFRFSFLITFFALFVSARAMEHLTVQTMEQVINGGILWVALFSAAVFFSNKKRYDFVSRTSLILTIIFIGMYLGLLFFYTRENRKPRKKLFVFLFLALFSVEGVVQANSLLQGIVKDWGYASRSLYEEGFSDIRTLVTAAEEDNTEFQRMELFDFSSRNQSFKYGYSGIQMFSSIRNRRSSQYLNQLGFRSRGSNLTISYKHNTVVMDALFGVAHNITKHEPLKYGFSLKQTENAYQLYENEYSLPLGILTDDNIFSDEVSQSQEALLQQLSGEDETLFYLTEPKIVDADQITIIEEDQNVIYSEKAVGETRRITYSVDVPANSQAYLMLYGDSQYLMKGAKVRFTIDGVQRSGDLIKDGQYYNLGYYSEAKTVEVELEFFGNSQTTLRKPMALILDTEAFSYAVEKAKENGADLTVDGRVVEGTVLAEKDQVLFTSIPYDNGWEVYVDGEKQKINALQDSFLTVAIPEGEHKVKFVYLPQGIKAGFSLFVGCTVLFLGYEGLRKRKARQEEKRKQEQQ
ncbi:YfhO family protein [Candidatus Enterococcus clewellii]|uniref:ABC transporter permease n=1 Tax=Candidatus Enterococcus clewellii TaxID=1834193 RepID=A0A242K8T6_9ENTE|nr:YfhO family protein [Enterococcus sp. 9E7_DIV0242]OTP17477.1 hypothetical protein A5888_001615 [Enterococcus sp. 9E7_DIV0242]